MEGHIQKMLLNYRTLLKKHVLLSNQQGFGKHEELQIESSAESIVHHGKQLLELVNELRVRALIRASKQQQEQVEAGESMDTVECI